MRTRDPKKTALGPTILVFISLFIAACPTAAASAKTPPKDGTLKRVAAPGKLTAMGVAALPDGYAVAGTILSKDGPSNGKRAWAAKVTTKGKKAWEVMPGGKRRASAFASTARLAPGAVMLGTIDPSADDKDGAPAAWLVKADKAGLIRWERPFGFDGGGASGAYLDASEDGAILTAGGAAGKDGADVGFMAEFDRDGNLAWGRRFEGFGAFTWAHKLADGSYAVLTGNAVGRVGAAGDTAWQHGTDLPMRGATTPDGRVILLAGLPRKGVLRVTYITADGDVTLDTTLDIGDACSIAGLYVQGVNAVAGGGTCGKGKQRIWTASVSPSGELLSLGTQMNMVQGYDGPAQFTPSGTDGFIAAGPANGSVVWIFKGKSVKKEAAKANKTAKKKAVKKKTR